MRSMWSGSISFGMVNIPIKLYSPVKSNELSFNLLHKSDYSPIRYAKICRADGHEIAQEDIVKGFQYQKGDYVVLTDEDFEKADPKKTKSIEIVSFVNEDEIDSIYFEKPYYIEPEKVAKKAYALLRIALEKSKKVAVGKFVLKNREHLVIIKPYKNGIVLDQIRFEDDIDDMSELNISDVETNKKELELAMAIIKQLSAPFKPSQFKDTYREEMEDIIEKKIEGKVPAVETHAPEPTTMKDLMSALKESLEKAQKPERTKAKAKHR